MSITSLINELVPANIQLEQIFLDPNNPRFVDSNWEDIPDAQICDGDTQDTTRKTLIARFNVEKLRINMEVNGYLPIDRVIIRKIDEDKYVVLEGNRRICAAKLINDIAVDGSTVMKDVQDSLQIIPCLIYTGSGSNVSWIFQGLRHITGINDWSAFHKARLLVEQMEDEGLNLTDVGKRFGLSAFGAGQWVRGYYAFKQAREESDYITEIDERSYPYFQELFSRSSTAVRDWMEWDDRQYKFLIQIHFNEYVSWLYPRESDDESIFDNDICIGTENSGKWGDRWLVKRDDIRNVAYLIREAPELFQEFRHSGDIEKQYSIAISKKHEEMIKTQSDPIKDVFESVRECVRNLDVVPLKLMKDDTLKAQLLELLDALQEKINYIKE